MNEAILIFPAGFTLVLYIILLEGAGWLRGEDWFRPWIAIVNDHPILGPDLDLFASVWSLTVLGPVLLLYLTGLFFGVPGFSLTLMLLSLLTWIGFRVCSYK